MNSPSPFPIESDRLRLSLMSPRHLRSFVAYRQHPDVARYQSWSEYTIPDGRALIEANTAAPFAQDGHWYQIAIELKGSDIHVGDLALRFFDECRQGELGATLDPAHQGHGYAVEAASALLHYVFTQGMFHRVIAITDALNHPAAALMRRLGFRQEGHFLKNTFFKGAWGDELSFAILAEEWLAKHPVTG